MFWQSQFRVAGLILLLIACSSARAATGRLDPAKTAQILAFPGQSGLKTAPLTPEETAKIARASASITAVELIEEGKYERAIDAYSKAIDADSENSNLFMGRGVAQTLARKYKPAIDDLQRAQRLNPQNREAKLWLCAALELSGDTSGASMLYPPGLGIPDDYASFIYNTMAVGGMMLGRGVGSREEVESNFLRAGQWFARRVKSGDAGATIIANPEGRRPVQQRSEMSAEQIQMLFNRARANLAAGKFVVALNDLDMIGPKAWDDPAYIEVRGDASLAVGDLDTARWQLTRLLTRRPDYAPGYLSRAMTYAKLGAVTRAQADLDMATKLDRAAASAQRAAIEAAIAVNKSTAQTPIQALLAKLETAAGTDAPLSQPASALVTAMNEKRLWFDYIYQHRIADLFLIAKQNPSDPNRLLELAEYVDQQLDPPATHVGPRDDATALRSYNLAREATWAEAMADAVLAADPNEGRATIVKCEILIRRQKWNDAQKMLQTLVARRTDLAEAFNLLSEIYIHQGQDVYEQAVALRDKQTEWSDGVYIYRETAAARTARFAEVDRLMAESKRLADLGIAQLSKAAQSAGPSTAKGQYYLAMSRFCQKDYAGERDILEKVVKLDPNFYEAQQRLWDCYDDLDQSDQSLQVEQSALNRLIETTAAPILNLALEQIPRTAYVSAAKALQQGSSADPADSRCYAYLAIVRLAEQKNDDATRLMKQSLAIEDATLRLNGDPMNPSNPRPIRKSDIGLSTALRLKLGSMLLAQNKPAAAKEIFSAITAIEPRVPPDLYPEEVPDAMLPDLSQDPNRVPEADNVVALLAWARLGLGRALLATGDTSGAVREFNAVLAYGPRLINGNGRERLFAPESGARSELSEIPGANQSYSR